MRDIIAVCRSTNASRVRVASVLDRYFTRIGDQTWRGIASNACLDRVSRELRVGAKRNTAVMIQEVRSTYASRTPLIRIGSKTAFFEDGRSAVATHPARFKSSDVSAIERHWLACIRIAALFHDIGKACIIFQRKLRAKGKVKGDVVRHDLISAVVWDKISSGLGDADLASRLTRLTPSDVDSAWELSKPTLIGLHDDPDSPMVFDFMGNPASVAYAVGMLVLTHHRLPVGTDNHLGFKPGNHVRSADPLVHSDLDIAPGSRFWHEDWWTRKLVRDVGDIEPGKSPYSLDMAMRLSLVFADHAGSAASKVSNVFDGHMANTKTIWEQGKKSNVPADTLSVHVAKVYARCLAAGNMLVRLGDNFPALFEGQVPVDILAPRPATGEFAWQEAAASATRTMCAGSEGGFFGCILAGTGTGKTRGAPTILAAAAFSDAVPSRRRLRMTLGLGLRTLATQSAREYVEKLGFSDEAVAVLVGRPPLQFSMDVEKDDNGSENAEGLPAWLKVEGAYGSVPAEGDDRELDWLRSLSLDTDSSLPEFAVRLLEKDGPEALDRGRKLLESPVLACTVDHVMEVVSPGRTSHKFAALRVMTSDLILDEIDEYGPEDLGAICRLVYQVGVSGRRVMVMSASLDGGIASRLYACYASGWTEYARWSGRADHVNVLCCGSDPASIRTNLGSKGVDDVFDASRNAVVVSLSKSVPRRLSETLATATSWKEMVSQVDASCSRLHDFNHVVMRGKKVSIGVVKMTRIKHTVAMAMQLPGGRMTDSRIRLKICFHSQFPRLHREWMERKLSRALDRTGDFPDAKLEEFLEEQNVFQRAGEAENIEIVLVTSPVIETGNNLDFDWGCFEPVFSRSVVQGPGRVRRHRAANGKINVVFLGISAVALEKGRLSLPGIETPPHRETGVKEAAFPDLTDRATVSLMGGSDIHVVDARFLLEDNLHVPLLREERKMRAAMMDTGENEPIGMYIRDSRVRLNLRISDTRKFRRSDVRDMTFLLVGENFQVAEWHVNRTPSLKGNYVDAAGSLSEAPECPDALFQNMHCQALADYLEQSSFSPSQLSIMNVDIPDYGRGRGEREVTFTWSDFTGFVSGNPGDILLSFGKT